MDPPRYASKARCLTIAIAISFLSACLIRTVVVNFAPVYGAVTSDVTVRAYLTVYSKFYIVGVILIPSRKLYEYYELLCRLAIGFAFLLWPLERLVLFPLSRHVPADWMVWGVTLVVASLFPVIAWRLVLDACPENFRTKAITREIFRPQLTYGVIILGICFMIGFLYGLCDTLFVDPITYWTTTHSHSYIWVSTLVGRGPLQFHIALALYACLRQALGLSGGGHVLTAIILFVCLQPLSTPITQLMLGRHGYSLLSCGESVTGYISVLENAKSGLRILKNDHSILGGHWLLTPQRRKEGIYVEESIYSAFYMLEAVRLIEPGFDSSSLRMTVSRVEHRHTTPDAAKNALVIGLGIGTAPSALVRHGIDTTVVEIDPLVTGLARQYFNLESAVDVRDEDALHFANRAVQFGQTYSYIIHDVFTGGAEPQALFTTTFLTNLRQLLKPSGAIAINYAGNLKAETTLRVLHRIQTIFHNSCRIYRDNSAPPDPPRINSTTATTTSHAHPPVDFANLIAFCSTPPWRFREPILSDYLGSAGRRDALKPQHEVKIMFDEEMMGREMDERRMREEQRASARQHWRIMRGVLPDGVWENW